jgi:hypothetical protein
MPAHRKASIRELAADAHQLNSGVVQGRLRRHSDTGAWMVGDRALDDLLESYRDEEIVLIATSLEDDTPMPKRVCRTCGTEYRGSHCPRCREARLRLRGR